MARCPVCKTECENNICLCCGFDEVGRIFVNKEEADLWYNETLIPYRNKVLEQSSFFKIEENVLIKFFKDNKHISKINVPFGVRKVSNKAFENCDWITNVSMPNTLEEVGTGAFRKCRNLVVAELPFKNIKFGKEIFADCISLSSINLPEGISTITDRIFFQCRALSSIYLPKSITKIGWQAFFDCYSLTTLEIPDNVKSIEGCAFGFCKSLQSLKIGKGVKKIADNAFHYCGALTSIEVDDNPTYIVRGNALIDKKHSKLIRGSNSSFIPNGVKIIGEGAFSGCETIREIKISSTVTQIDQGAFSSCLSLSYIVIPENVNIIGYNALFTDMTRRINVFCEHVSKPAGWHEVWYNKFDDLTGSQKCVYWAGEWHYENGIPTPNERNI